MKVFILDNVENLTHSYHPGGLVVIARDEASARALVAGSARGESDDDADKRPSVTDAEWANAIVYGLAGAPKPRIFVFPNAGCC